MFLNLDGTVSQLQNAFGTTIQIFNAGSAKYYANSAPLYLPQSIAPFVTSTIGMENYTYFAPLAQTPSITWPLSQPPYVPATVQAAYNETSALSHGIDGTGQTVVLVDAFGDVNAITDLAEFSAASNLPVPTFTLQTVNATNTVQDISTDSVGIATSAQPVGWDAETALDIEWAHAMAPGAAIVNMIGLDQGVGLAQAVATSIADHAGSVVSQSFGLWEGDANNANCCVTGAGNVTLQTFAIGQQTWIQYLHSFYQMAAATGITVLASSGDSGSGSGCCSGTAPAVAVNYPAADSFVTGVGGTSLYADSHGYKREAAWSGSGGGFSTLFARPAWQQGPGVLVNGPALSDGSLARGVPDIAAVADSNTGVLIVIHGAPLVTGIGGTSVAAPVWGGIIAVLNSNQPTPEGFYSPTAYIILNSPSYCGQFHDTTSGSNGAYSAAKGWDPVTGVGSPNIGYLLYPASAPTCTAPPGVAITSPTSGQIITSTSLVVAGAHSLQPGNYVVGSPNSAPAYETGTQQNQLNILAGWIDNYRVVNNQPFFDAHLNISDLSNLAVTPAPSTGEVWYLQWDYGGTTWFATMRLTLQGTVSGSVAGRSIGISFGVGHVQVSATGGQLYNTTNTEPGSYTATAPGTITVTVPASLVGNPTAGSMLRAMVASTEEIVGYPIGLLEGVDSVSANDPYALGDPLLPDGYIQLALNNNFQGATNASLVNYPDSNAWQATVNLAGQSAGTQTVYARTVIKGVPGTDTSVAFVYNPPNQNPPSGLTVSTGSTSYIAKQNVIVFGQLVNPSTGNPIPSATVQIQVVDPYGTTVFSRRVTTNSTGGYSTSYHLPKNAIQGYYTIYAASNGYAATTRFVVDNAPPSLTNVQVNPTTGTHNTMFTVSANSTDNVAIYTVYALVETQLGTVVENVSMTHQTSTSYSASFTLPQTAPVGTYSVQVHSIDVAGKTATAQSTSFTLTS